MENVECTARNTNRTVDEAMRIRRVELVTVREYQELLAKNIADRIEERFLKGY
jgi:hypothetical protein